MSIARHHAEWLSLVPVSGPFLSLPVLMEAFSAGLEPHDPEHSRLLRQEYGNWLEAVEKRRGDPAPHQEWIRFVLGGTLGLDDRTLVEGQAIPQTLQVEIPEHHELLRPSFIVVDPGTKTPRMLVKIYPRSQELTSYVADSSWKASPDTRMTELLHGTGVRLGLVTNGEHWMLVDAPIGETTGFASWYANLWLDEPITLRAFRSLLSVERFFGVSDDQTLEALLKKSASNQQEVTDQLGYQVRRAVEVLIHSLDRADQDFGRELLAGVREEVLYESALTVMMRLVFLFCAEERELIPSKPFPVYEQNYSVSTISKQLRDLADQHGEESLERRFDAWPRLLAAFRAVYGGLAHDDAHIPAYGGNLFNPDRFPFLEGRKAGTIWREAEASPLPVNNRTVLHLLEALQLLQVRVPGGGPAEARRVSFRALDIEQIGHVYEGLLDHTARRAAEPFLGLAGTRDKEPEIPLAELERYSTKDQAKLIKFLKDQTGRSESALKKALGAEIDDQLARRFRTACQGDEGLWERVRPFAGLVRLDNFGYPVAIPKGSVFVTEGTDRRSSGTHYTPRELTEPIVKYTLEPLVYTGPAEGMPKDEWKLKSARDLLDLKICDMACGSGAFLVEADRYLADRLVEAWDEADRRAQTGQQGDLFHPKPRLPAPVIRVTPYGDTSAGSFFDEVIPFDPEERKILARRVVAQRCLYGVDKNPLAVEMAKLSLWLLTMAKDRPFTFLDHAIRPGDSLVGVSTEQLKTFSLDGRGTGISLKNFLDMIPKIMEATRQLRVQLERIADETMANLEEKERLFSHIRFQTKRLNYAADRLLAASWNPGKPAERMAALREALKDVDDRIRDVDPAILEAEGRELRRESGCPDPFQWAVEFPEVFLDRGGFDAFVGNPPFMGGQKITGNLGNEYRDYLVEHLARGKRGSADLCAYFFLRANHLLRTGGQAGLIATNTIAQGDTREVGLDQIIAEGSLIPRAVPSRKWPGTASLEVAHVWLRKPVVHVVSASGGIRLGGSASASVRRADGTEEIVQVAGWASPFVLDDKVVSGITPFLTEPGMVSGPPHRLAANAGKSFQGSIVLGMGFVMTPEEAQRLIDKDPRNKDVLFPYLNGEDLNSRPDQSPSRWVINFFDWPLGRVAGDEWRVASEERRKTWLASGFVGPDQDGPVAADYPDCLAIIEEKVKPDRTRRNDKGEFALRKPLPQKWWIYAEKRPALYRTIAGMERVLVISRVTHHVGFADVSSAQVFADRLFVFAFDGNWKSFVLSSWLHEVWVREYSGTFETRLNYSPTDCFETFPFPATLHPSLATIGETYHEHRRQIMLDRRQGLTKTYNRFHDPEESDEAIERLRALHVEMDRAVAAAYGWTDLDLAHGFHETKQGLRFTISDPARREILARLLKLNHERYAQEIEQNQGETKPKRRSADVTKPKRPRKEKASSRPAGMTLFDSVAVDTAFPATDRERRMCGLLSDLVAAKPRMQEAAYRRALILALGAEKYGAFLLGEDRARYMALALEFWGVGPQDPEPSPWTDLLRLLTMRGILHQNANAALEPDQRFGVGRATYPACEPEFIRLIHQATERLEERLSSVQTLSQPDDDLVSQFNQDEQALFGGVVR